MPIIQSYIDETNAKVYIEPFIGGANVIDKIKCERRYGNDINHYLIELFKHLDEISTLPEEISKEEYAKVRKAYQDQTNDYPDWYIGAVGFLASYNGKFFGGRAGTVTTKIGTIRYKRKPSVHPGNNFLLTQSNNRSMMKHTKRRGR